MFQMNKTMKTRIRKSFLKPIVIVAAGLMLYSGLSGQSATLGGTLSVNNTEGDVRTGGETIVITLSGESWEGDLGDPGPETDALLDGFTGDGNWAAIRALLTDANVIRNSNTVATITLPAVPGYNIFSNETLKLTIGGDALLSGSPLAASNDLTILADPVLGFNSGNLVTGSTQESDIRTGGRVLEVKVRNDVWVPTIGDDNSITTAFLDGITGTQNWSVVRAALNSTHVTKQGDTVVRVNLPAVPGYYLEADESVSVNIPGEALLNTGNDVISTPDIAISNEAVSISVDGSVTSGATEGAIRNGGETLDLTIKGDVWADDVGNNITVTNGILKGITGSTSWNNQVRDALDLANVQRISDSEVRITLPAAAAYDISVIDNITVTVTSAAIEHLSTGSVIADEGFSVSPAAATVSVSGNIQSGANDQESSIRAGGSTIILTLSEDSWVADIGLNTIANQQLINGISGNQIWNTAVRPLILGADRGASNVSVSGDIVTIQIPAIPGYYLESDENLSITIPALALLNSGTSINAIPSLTILNEEVSLAVSGSVTQLPQKNEEDIRSGGETLVLTLTGDQWADDIASNSVTANNLFAGISGNLGTWDATVQPALDVSDIVRNSSTVITINLPAVASYDITSAETVSVSAASTVLKYTTSGQVNGSPGFTITSLGASVSVSGNIQSGLNNTESEIRAGGSTIILTLSEDSWVGTLGNENSVTSSLVNGINGGTSWNTFVIPAILGADQGASNVGVSGNTVTITIPQVPNYYLNGNDLVTVTVPSSALQSTADNVVASPTLTIQNEGVSMTVSGTLTGVTTEEDIRNGGRTLVLDLTGDEWPDNIASSTTVSDILFAGISGDGTEWNSKVRDNLTTTHIVRNSNTRVTITLPATAGYDISSAETVQAVAAAGALKYSNTGSVTGSPSVQILPLGGSISVSGNIQSGVFNTESKIREGGATILLTVTEDSWVSGLGNNNTTTADLINGISGSSRWNSSVRTAILGADNGAANVSVSGSIVTINIPAVSDYYINSNDIISITVPANALNSATSAITASPTLTIQNEPVSLAITGTLVSLPTETEQDIRDGGETMILTLTGDEWATGVESDPTLANALINGINGSGTAWNSVVKPLINASHITRNSNTRITLTLPAAPAYEIDAAESITVSAAASTLQYLTTGSVTGSPAMNIVPLGASIEVSGTIQSGSFNTEEKIREGGGTIILTVSEDTWVSSIGNDNSVTAALVNGISGSAEWNTKVVSAILGSNNGAGNVSRSGSIVTINVPAVPNYNIASVDNISILVPNVCLNNTSSGSVAAFPTLAITPAAGMAFINDPGLIESDLNGSTLQFTLQDETFLNSTLESSNFSHNGPASISIVSANYVSPTQATLTLGFSGDIDSDLNDFRITVDANELSGTNNLTSNAISIQAELEPRITNVDIPDGVYSIGDEVTVLITVINDQGDTYAYNSGTVAGNPLARLERQSSTLYYGYFTVQEGQTDYDAGDLIPVTNLVLRNGSLIGDPFTGNVSGQVAIDGSKPKVTNLSVTNGTKKIGNDIDIIVTSNGINYTAIAPTSVNGVPISAPNVNLIELGNGIYILRYTVAEGDDDVSSGNLQAQIVMRDPSGNESDLFNTVSNNTLSIDANSPQISFITVRDSVYTIGDVIQVTIQTDGSNYNFDSETFVNGIPFTSTYLTGTYIGSNQYRLSYTVRATDPEIETGEIEVTVRMSDPAGNISAPYNDVESNNLALYTTLPTATLFGNQEICEKDSARLILNLTGRAPWTFYLNDGSNTREFTDVFASPFEFFVKPSTTRSYRVDSVFDFNGIKNKGTGNVTVTVNPVVDVEIINLNTSYSVEDEPVILQANVSGGTFSGPGVITATSTFNPGIADTLNSPHSIVYTYLTNKGCVSYDTAIVFVLGAEGDIFIPKQVFCDYDPLFEVIASNTADAIGSFRLLDEDEQEVSGLTDSLNNKASIDPSLLDPGFYIVDYSYEDDGTTLNLQDYFTVESAVTPKIITLDQSAYCQNEPAFDLEGDIATAVFSGPGVSGNVNDGFIFTPANAFIGNNTITYTNTTSNGCFSAASKTVRINYVPEIEFQVSGLCVSTSDTIFFDNTTINQYTIAEWSWEFGDINSGSQNFASTVDAFHVYTRPGVRTISLEGTTAQGCKDIAERVIEFGDKPTGNISWDNECFIEGDSILFVNQTFSENEITRYNWTFLKGSDQVGSSTGNDSVYFIFDNLDNYQVEVYVETEIGCSNVFKREIVLKPTILLADEGGYFEDFESGTGKWSVDQSADSRNISWRYGDFNFDAYGGEPTQAWYTELPVTEKDEQSWVISPCFDFRGVERPVISLDIFRSLQTDWEGVAMQYSVDNGESWLNLGSINEGVEWFNSFEITHKPGGQDVGWTGYQLADTFRNAKRYADRLTGYPNVRLRLIFGSDNTQYQLREGFAFDNFSIGTRTRKVLLEHFTNTTETRVLVPDGHVNFMYNKNFSDAVKIEYHTAFPGPDPFYDNSEFVSDARSLYYGINSVPYTLLDGGFRGDLVYNDPISIAGIDDNDILVQALEDPVFRIDVDAGVSGQQYIVNVDVEALADLIPEERILHVVVFEKLVEGVSTLNGQSNFLNVVRDMLPNAAGTASFNAWDEGQIEQYQFVWDVTDVEDLQNLRVAAFIQNDNNFEIYQVATNDETNLNTSAENRMADPIELTLFPVPSNTEVNLYLSAFETGSYTLEIYDKLGRRVHNEAWESYETLKTFDSERFTRGVYFVRLLDEYGQVRAIKKMVIIR